MVVENITINNLIRDIKLLEYSLLGLEIDWYAANKLKKDYKCPLDKYIERINSATDRLATIAALKEAKESLLEDMTKELLLKDGIEYQIFYLKYVKGLNLKEIADTLHYNHNYVRRKASEIEKSLEVTLK